MSHLNSNINATEEGRKRALFVLNNLRCGGAERAMLNTLRAMSRRGWSVDLALKQKCGEHVDEIIGEFDVFSLGVEQKSFASIRFLILLLKLGWRYQYIVGASITQPILYAWITARFCKAKCVGWVHTDIKSHASERARVSRILYQMLVPMLFRSVDSLVTPSLGAANSLTSWIQSEAIPVTNIPNIMDFLVLENKTGGVPVELQEWMSLRPTVVTAGRLTEQKNFGALIRAHVRILEIGIDHNLLILGEGAERTQIESVIEELGVGGTVRLAGFVSNPLSYFKLADVFALSSVIEGFSMVILEAMYTGLPVVAFDCSYGPAEILENGIYGILVDVGDIEGMAQGIAKLLADDEQRNKFSERSKERITAYSENNLLKRWEVVLDVSV